MFIKLKAIGFGIFISALIILAFDYVFTWLNDGDYYHVTTESSKPWYFEDVSGPGRRMTPENEVTQEFKISGKTVLKVRYNIDQYGRRAVPSQSLRGASHLLTFGDSWVFGALVNDEDTLAAKAALVLGDVRAYNYGAIAYGATNILAFLQSTSLSAQVAERAGALLYFSSNSVIRRVFGLNFYDGSSQLTPYYELANDGSIRRDGIFRTAHPLRTWFLGFLGKSNFLAHYDFFMSETFHAYFGADQMKFYIDVVRATKDEYLKQFPRGRFVYVCGGPAHPRAVCDAMPKAGFETIDLEESGLAIGAPQWRVLEKDGHPTGDFNRRVMEFIRSKL